MAALSERRPGDVKAAALIVLASLAVVVAGWTSFAARPQAGDMAAATVALRIVAAVAVVAALAVAVMLLMGKGGGGGDRTLALQSVAERIDHEVHAAIADIKGMTDGMTRDADRLLGVATNTSANAASAAAAATQAMASAETVSSATEQMHASISEIASQATGSSEVAKKAVQLANGARTMVGALHTATETVEAIVSIINGIVSRTDLLALNAAVEAARAGGAGKGFAVVAGEVKRLANQTQDATADIANRIGEMRAAVAQVGAAIDDVAKVIHEVEIAASSISSAAEEQSAATSEISRAVAEVSTASTGVAALMEGLSQEAGQGQELAEEVRMDSGRMAETVGGLGRAMSRVVRTAHSDVDRRRLPRFGTFLPAALSFAGASHDGSVADFSAGGCAVVSADGGALRAGQPLEVACQDFGRPRHGTVVALAGGAFHIRFSHGEEIEADLVESQAAAGSKIIIGKAKADHRAFVDSVRRVVEGGARMKASDLANHHTCRLGKWYDRVIDQRILANPSYKGLMEPHKRVHQAGKDALNLFHGGDRQGAARALDRLAAASQEVLAILDQLGCDV